MEGWVEAIKATATDTSQESQTGCQGQNSQLNLPLGIKERGELESKGGQKDGRGGDVCVAGRHCYLKRCVLM